MILKRKYILKESFYLCRAGGKLHAYTTLNAIDEGIMRNVLLLRIFLVESKFIRRK